MQPVPGCAAIVLRGTVMQTGSAFYTLPGGGLSILVGADQPGDGPICARARAIVAFCAALNGRCMRPGYADQSRRRAVKWASNSASLRLSNRSDGVQCDGGSLRTMGLFRVAVMKVFAKILNTLCPFLIAIYADNMAFLVP